LSERRRIRAAAAEVVQPRPRRYDRGVPKVTFTRHLARHLDATAVEAPGRTAAEVMNNVFATNHFARGYILEDGGGLRSHITLFIDGEPIRDRATLTDPVSANSEIYVMQALSGG
jgi:hypothetical protein